MEVNKVVVIGLGYIGLPIAALIASRKIKVVGVDINLATIDKINHKQLGLTEPGLNNLVKQVVDTFYLHAVSAPVFADVFIISVPTPLSEQQLPDLTAVFAAVEEIAPILKKGNLIIIESTIPVGSTEKIAHFLAKKRPDLLFPLNSSSNPDIFIAHCPERVLPGQVLMELVKNARIVGGLTRQCAHFAKNFYERFIQGPCVITDARTAEMTKLVENSFRAVNIAFANELSMMCDQLNVNPWELIQLANMHPRVNILQPSAGVGGHCIAIDPWFLVDSMPDTTHLIQVASNINNKKINWVIDKIKAETIFSSNIVITCLGLTYKADVDDIRESAAIKIICQLAAYKNLHILVVEPHIHSLPAALNHFHNVELVSTTCGLEQANMVIILQKHKAFNCIRMEQIAGKKVIDVVGLTYELELNNISQIA